MRGNRGYDRTKVFTNTELLVRYAAAAWTVENLGQDPSTTLIEALYEGESMATLDVEVKAWTRVAKACVQHIVANNGPLTLAEMDGVSRLPKFAKLY